MLSPKSVYLLAVALFLSIAVKAQNTVPANKNNIKLFFEKAYLHTDRDLYARGDTLWFKAYLVNAQNNIPATSSGTLYVDLITPDAQVVTTEIIRLENGIGHGDIDLPDT